MNIAPIQSGLQGRPPTTGRAGIAVSGTTASPVLLAFLFTLPILFSFEIAGLRLSPIRIFLLVACIPSIIALFNGRAGTVLWQDLAMFAFCLWVVLSLLVNDGLPQLANAGMTAIELFTGYVLGRLLIRNGADFRNLVRFYIWCLLLLLPFALVEFLTGRMLLHEIFSLFGQTEWKGPSSAPRWGLNRTMSGFNHPILYGLFCSMLASVLFYTYRHEGKGLFLRMSLVGALTFMSLSAAPLLALAVQAGLILWDLVTKAKWRLLIALVVLAYVLVDSLSNRTPITILINYVTFDPLTAWTRIAQWNYGTVAVWDHPIFGLGMGEKWATVNRPFWVSDSIDNLWLLTAMRYGLVGVVLLLLSIALMLWRIIRAKDLPEAIRDSRRGYVIGVVGLCFVLCTVHVWGSVSVFVFFFLGAGTWIADPVMATAPTDAAPAPFRASGRQITRTTRFETVPPRRSAK